MNIRKLIDMGALFVCNDSGGKDSQCMKAKLMALVPTEQMVIIHAHLPGVEWEGTVEHIERYNNGVEFHVVRAVKTLFDMVRHRRRFPDAKNRQCTSDLKRGPIDKKIREVAKRKGCKLIVNCMGIRAQESVSRAKKRPFTFNWQQSKAGRKWYNWYPIFNYSIEQVWQTIADAEQVRHWAYDQGMTRLSCCFCILASQADLRTAARLNPELYKKYLDLEREVDHTMVMPAKGKERRYLNEVVEGKRTEPKQDPTVPDKVKYDLIAQTIDFVNEHFSHPENWLDKPEQ